MMNKYKYQILLLFFLILSSLSNAQWQLLPNTENKQYVTMEVSGKYMFLSSYMKDSAVVRIDLSDNTWMNLKKKNGNLFKANAFQYFCTSGKHIQFLNEDSIFVSHDYGLIWDKKYSLGDVGYKLYAKDSIVLLGTEKSMVRSGDYGDTYKFMYYDGSFLTGAMNPLLIYKKQAFMSYNGGLMSFDVNKVGTGVVVYNKADPFDYMVNYTDTLISADLENLYQSINNGYTWTSLNNTFKGNYINQMVINNNLLYLCVSLKGLQVSLDKGQHFYSLNGDIPASKYIRRVAFDSAYIYVLTTNGIYRRANNVDQSVGGVSSFQNAESLQWFPNPTESIVTLPLSNIQSVEVYNLVGQKMNVPANIQILQAQLDMSNLPSGVYQVRLLTPHGQSVSKVIKL